MEIRLFLKTPLKSILKKMKNKFRLIIALVVSSMLQTDCIYRKSDESFFSIIRDLEVLFVNYYRIEEQGDVMCSFKDFGVDDEWKKEILKNPEIYPEELSYGKDSIINYMLCVAFHEKIKDQLQEMCLHPDFIRLSPQIFSLPYGMDVSVSEDQKLWNFSYYSQNGGTARIMKSMVFYAPQKKFWFNSESFDEKLDNSFNDDGYARIYNLSNGKRPNYLLHGYAKLCSTCSFHYFKHVQIDKGGVDVKLVKYFENRGWGQKMNYNPRDSILTFDCKTDDMMKICDCPLDEEIEIKGETVPKGTKCSCTYKFNGSSFVEFNED